VTFLGLIIDSTLSWKAHINQLGIKLSFSAYAIRTLSFVMFQTSLYMSYYAFVHSIIYSVSILFVVKNMDIFILNSDIYNIHIRHGSDLHHATYKLTKVQKGVLFSGIMIFNN
jgi:hypothetical protein